MGNEHELHVVCVLQGFLQQRLLCLQACESAQASKSAQYSSVYETEFCLACKQRCYTYYLGPGAQGSAKTS